MTRTERYQKLIAEAQRLREQATEKQKEISKLEEVANELSLEAARTGIPIKIKVGFCIPRFIGDMNGYWVERQITDVDTIAKLQSGLYESLSVGFNLGGKDIFEVLPIPRIFVQGVNNV